MDFEWDQEKAASNFDNHGVTFDEAATAFSDPLSLTIPDPDHSEGEYRYMLLGLSDEDRLIVVSHTERGAKIRFISARLAASREIRDYEQGT